MWSIPLLQNDRANYDDACEIWVQELAALLEPELEGQPRLFDRAREGQTTNITAFLFAHSSPERQRASPRSVEENVRSPFTDCGLPPKDLSCRN